MPVHDPKPFSVHVDPDALARHEFAAATGVRPATSDGAEQHAPDERHDAADARLAARQRAEQDRAGRAAGAPRSRAYAFRRS